MKKLMKTLALSAGLIAVLGACAKKDSSSKVAGEVSGAVSSGGGGRAEKAKLLVWETDGVEREFTEWAIGEFKKLPENKKVEIEYQPVSNVDARSKIELDGPAGVGADVFVAPHDHIGALVTGGHVMEIDNAEEYLSNFVGSAQLAAQYDGKAYGYPLASETYALFYNKALLKDNEVPKTWDEVKALAKKFNDPSQNKYALVFEPANAYYTYIFLESFGAPLFGHNGNDIKQHNINSAGAIKGMQFFQTLKKDLLPVEAADATGDFCAAEFTQGKAMMSISGPWSIKSYKTAGVDIGVSTLPAAPGSDKPSVSFAGVRLAFVSSYTKSPDAAKRFAKFITSKDALQKRFEITAQIPPVKGIEIDDAVVKGFYNQLEYARVMPTIPAMGKYWSSMGSACSGIWNGDDVKATLDAAAVTMESEL